jgi:hypothetical protein
MQQSESVQFITISNRKTFAFFRWLVLVLLALVAADVALSFLPGSLGDIAENHYVAFVSAAILLLLLFLRINYFFYDDSYEILHIRSKGLWFMGIGEDINKRYDFPKRKVTDFRIEKTFLHRTLYLTLDNYASETRKTRSVDISFLKDEEIDRLQTSLERIVAKNQVLADRGE